MTTLAISPDLSLPIEAVTEAIAILGRRGRGKTVTASVFTEELIGAGLPVVVLDPTGAWWGLRSSADGTAPGLPVVIFGGDHADVPLDETAGRQLAEIIAEQRFPAVIDLSLLSKSAARRFVADFAETLYHRNREPLHLVVDECDLYMPQRVIAGMERLVGAMDDIVRRGRLRGLGVTLISQRPAVVNKDVLSQVGTLIALGLTGTHDIKAIDEWVRLHADEDEAKAVKASLPSLPAGTAWVWSPSWLGLLRQVHVRMRHTFDSSATPKVGQVRAVPKEWAHVDVAALSDLLAAPAAPDTKPGPSDAALRRRVADLERELTTERARTRDVERVEVPAVGEDALIELAGALVEYRKVGDRIAVAVDRVMAGFERAASAPLAPAPAPVRPTAPPAPRRTPIQRQPTAAEPGISRCERAILTVLAQHGRRSTTQVALLAGYSHKSGSFRNSLSSLRSAGRIEGRGEVEATRDGLAALGEYEPLPAGPALVDWWYGQLGKAERAILAAVVEAWPVEVPVEEIADRTGYSATSGGFRNALSRLRSLELASGRGALRAADVLGQAAREGRR